VRPGVPACLAAVVAAVVLAFPQARAAGQGAVSTVAPVRVNAGGGAYLTRSHVSWAADRGFAGGWSWSTRSRIAGTGEPGLFQTQRFGARGYELPVGAPGRFRVKLLLAEGQFSARGKRVFDVSAEGRAALRNVDIFAAKGRNAYMPTFDTQVTDGRLSLGFTARRYVAAVAGIEAVYLGPLPAMTTPTTTTGPGAVDGQQLYVSPSGSDQQPGTARRCARSRPRSTRPPRGPRSTSPQASTPSGWSPRQAARPRPPSPSRARRAVSTGPGATRPCSPPPAAW